jgi:alkanesulfonate monooxygenase SsuD/methylene tetrahydromethanopterin reductase-like flavin-dependent oxidoreductase (luciferase family)
MVGGVGDITLRIAANHANSVNLYGSPERIAERVGVLESLCCELGTDFDGIEVSLQGELAPASTREYAEAMAARTASAQGLDLDSPRDSWVIGTPDEAADQLRRYSEVGVSHWISTSTRRSI